MPGRSCSFHPAELSPAEREIERNVRAHIQAIATEIGERHKDSPLNLERSRKYVVDSLESIGYTVAHHTFDNGVNISAQTSASENKIIVVGAHYDTVPGSPGANDNGSGVAALLELARLFAGRTTCKQIRFVAFDNEEHVGQPATAMGSNVYAQHCKAQSEEIVGMWSLETIGYFCSDADSQRYPEPFDLFYPTTADFVAFVGNAQSRQWVRRSVDAFRRAKAFPAEGVAAPKKFADINRSDNWGFSQAGYPALMVTDTANFRYRHYHTEHDTPDKVSYVQLARLVRVLSETLSALADS